MFKRFLCLFLALMLPCVALADYVMAGLDPENTYRDWNTNLFMKRMQEKTGVVFTYQQYKDAAQWKQAKASMTADGDLPDVLFKAEMTTQETTLGLTGLSASRSVRAGSRTLTPSRMVPAARRP